MIRILHIDENEDHHAFTRAQLLNIDSDLDFMRVASAEEALLQQAAGCFT